MECNIIRDLLPIYADGLESEESRALIEAHLEGCPDCRAQLERMRAQVDAPGRAAQAEAQAGPAYRAGRGRYTDSGSRALPAVAVESGLL